MLIRRTSLFPQSLSSLLMTQEQHLLPHIHCQAKLNHIGQHRGSLSPHISDLHPKSELSDTSNCHFQEDRPASRLICAESRNVPRTVPAPEPEALSVCQSSFIPDQLISNQSAKPWPGWPGEADCSTQLPDLGFFHGSKAGEECCFLQLTQLKLC